MKLQFNACINTATLTPALARRVGRQLAEILGDTVTMGPVFDDEAVFIVERSHLSPIVVGTTYGDVMLESLDFDFLCAGAEADVLFGHVEIRIDGDLAWDSSAARANA